MKKITLTICLLTLCVFTTLAQPKNSVRTNLTTGLAFGDYNATYETKLSDKFSLSTRTNFMSHTGIPFGKYLGLDTLNRQFPGIKTDLSQLQITAGGVRPEFRFHRKGQGLSGGYIGFFTSAQIGKLSPIIGAYYREENGNLVESEIEFAPKINYFGGGISFGHQWIFGPGITLDITWISLGAGVTSFSALGSSSTMTRADYDNYANQINSKMIDLPLVTPKATSSDEGVTLEIKTFAIVPRVLQFGIGFSF